MIRAIIIIGFLMCTLFSNAQPTVSLTDSLVKEFHEAWNSNDLKGMVELLHPDAFFFSPNQLRYGREVMANTVLKANPPVIKDCYTEEWESYN